MINKKIGILGGGQLGKMLCQAASKMSLDVSILDSDTSYPAGQICSQFYVGNFKDHDSVIDFGQKMDLLTIEIESVNTDALKKLSQEGKDVYPQPEVVEIIKDKGLQKKFYDKNGIPTSPFKILADKKEVIEALKAGEIDFPFVQKLRQGGYDGKGVQVIRSQDEIPTLFDAPSVIESLVAIDKEISVIVARNLDGEIKCYPPAEMIFNHEANLLDYQVCPARISDELASTSIDIATKVAASYGIVGLLAVELFLDKEGRILVNEVAPRPHNSGHHTIEAAITSQYEQHLRAILNLPLGNTDLICKSVLLNVLGAKGASGVAQVSGLADCLKQSGVHIHLYGKVTSKPFRKMGHVTITDDDLDRAIEKSKFVKDNLKVYANG